MTARPSRPAIIWAIVAKDLREFSRDRLWMILTPLALVMFVAIFWFLPATTEETITIGVYQRGLDPVIDQIGEAEEGVALRIVEFDGPEALRAAVEERRRVEIDGETATLMLGIAFPDDFVPAVSGGGLAEVTLYLDASAPVEIRSAMSSMVREIAYGLAGVALPVTEPAQETVVLGEDRLGNQVPLRDRMRPLFAFFILMTESIALAGLVAVEIVSRTAKAVVATPASVGDLLAAKGITGVILTLSQALILLLALGSFAHQPLLLLVSVAIGAVMMSGVGMIAGASGRDFITTLFISVVLVVPLAIPAFSILFPGTASTWVQALPSYGVIETMVGATSYGVGWSGALGNLGLAAAWCIGIFAAGLLLLRRRVEAL
jgi:ABC-2 type transport system permease protein